MGISYQRLSRVAKWFSPSGQGRPTAAVGVALALFGILGLSIVGFGGMLDGHTAVLIAVTDQRPGGGGDGAGGLGAGGAGRAATRLSAGDPPPYSGTGPAALGW
jgi:hypothetical protein